MERLGIDTPTSKARRASASARMQGAGGPPPPEGVPTPTRHSWPVVGRVVNINGKVIVQLYIHCIHVLLNLNCSRSPRAIPNTHGYGQVSTFNRISSL